MTRELLDRAASRLDAAGIESPRADAEWLLAAVLGVSRSALAVASVTEDQRTRYEELVSRRQTREPLQHILGTAPFRYVEVQVGPGVFVPRPETEAMVGWAVDQLQDRPDSVVVDLCTGSGAVALALVNELPNAVVHAVELDEDAHAYAVRNLAGSGVDLRLGDIAAAFPDLDGRCDLVVANPPYIPLDAWESVDPEARTYEPALALWADGDGLETIRVVEQVARRLLKPGGLVACEHADVQGEQAPKIFLASGGWAEVRDHCDLAGRDRFVTARRL